jgi:rod shape determining protein RodA
MKNKVNHFGNFIRTLKLDRADKILVVVTCIMLLIGLTAQSSVAMGKFFFKQLTYVFFGVIVFYIAYSLPTIVLKKACWYIYGIAVLLLIVVLVGGTSALGAQRWISIGGFSLQPSEAAKLACIIALAFWFESNKPRTIWSIIRSGVIILLLPFILIFIQPDLGTSMVLIAIFISMAYWSGARLHQLFALCSPLVVILASALGDKAFSFPPFMLGTHKITLDCSYLGLVSIFLLTVIFGVVYKVWKSKLQSFFLGCYSIFCLLIAIIGRPLLWGVLEPYQQKRLTIFLDPQIDPFGAGYNIIQSLIAVGSGAIAGQGYRQGRLTQGQFVPEQHTDFVFSSISEEWGFVGAFILLTVFFIICFRLYMLAKDLDEGFDKNIVIGILTYLCFHACINISMNIGLMPVTGVPLLMISYGGTSLWVTLFCLGITQRIYADHTPAPLFR